MQNREKVLDDIAKLAGGTASIISGVGGNIKTEIKGRVDEVIDRLDLVPRSDFERLEALLQETRIAQDEICARLDALEAASKPAKKTKTKKTTKK